MRANEFFKSIGIDGVRKFIKHNNIRSDDMLNELKRLIESHDRVMEHGSINKAKEYAESKYTAPEIKSMLLQDIANVESCQ